MLPPRVPRHDRASMRVAVVITAVSLALLPLVRIALGPSVSFLPTVLAVVGCLDLITLYLLSGEYRDTVTVASWRPPGPTSGRWS